MKTSPPAPFIGICATLALALLMPLAQANNFSVTLTMEVPAAAAPEPKKVAAGEGVDAPLGDPREPVAKAETPKKPAPQKMETLLQAKVSDGGGLFQLDYPDPRVSFAATVTQIKGKAVKLNYVIAWLDEKKRGDEIDYREATVKGTIWIKRGETIPVLETNKQTIALTLNEIGDITQIRKGVLPVIRAAVKKEEPEAAGE